MILFGVSLGSGLGLMFLPEGVTPYVLFLTVLGYTGALNLVW